MELIEEAWLRKEYREVHTRASAEDSVIALAWKALADWKLGRRGQAEVLLRQAFAAMPPSENTTLQQRTLVSMLLESELAFAGEAIAVAELIDRLGVGLPLALRVLADDAERRTGNPVEGFKLLTRAKAMDPADPETDFSIASLHARGGRAAKATAALKDALAHASDGQDYRALARAHPDFAGLRSDPAFLELVNSYPEDQSLAELATALDAFSWERVVKTARTTWKTSADPIFVLRAWDEALQGLLSRSSGEPDAGLLADLDVVGQELAARDPERTGSANWVKFRPVLG